MYLFLWRYLKKLQIADLFLYATLHWGPVCCACPSDGSRRLEASLFVSWELPLVGISDEGMQVKRYWGPSSFMLTM